MASSLKPSVILILVLSGLSSAGWLALIVVPYGWHKKLSIFYTMYFGLHHGYVGKGVAGGVIQLGLQKLTEKLSKSLSDSIVSAFSAIEGDFSIQEARDTFCAAQFVLNGQFCTAFTHLMWSSYALIAMACLGILLLGLGASFLYYYWAVKAREQTWEWAMHFYVAAPCCFILGLVQYMAVTYDFGSMPPGNDGMTFSVAVMFAWFATVASCLPFVILKGFVEKSHSEVINEAISAQKHHLADMEAANIEAYGATLMAGGSVAPPQYAAYNAPHQAYNGELAPPAQSWQPNSEAPGRRTSTSSAAMPPPPPSYGS